MIHFLLFSINDETAELILHGRVVIWQRETETVHFMQVVPWLGVVPNKDGQLQQLLCDDNFSPVVSLFKEATTEVLYSTSRINCPAFLSMAKQAEVVGTLLLPISLVLMFPNS